MRKIRFGLIVIAVCGGLLWTGMAGTANALDPEERAKIMCEGKLHVCFRVNRAEMDEILNNVSNARDPLGKCQVLCGVVDTPSCTIDACVDRCMVASGAEVGAISCQ